MSKNKQIWLLDSSQVERIKSGIFKYISENQAYKSKQKHLIVPDTAITPKRTTIKKQKITPNKNAYFSSNKKAKLSKTQQRTINDVQVGQMPKGFTLTDNGKILRLKQKNIQEPKTQIQPTIINNKVILDHQLQDTNTMNLVMHKVQICQTQQNKEEVNAKVEQTIMVTKQVKQNNKLGQKQEVRRQNQQNLQNKASQSQSFSVFQLAKRFGGNKNSINAPPSNQNQKKKITENITNKQVLYSNQTSINKYQQKSPQPNSRQMYRIKQNDSKIQRKSSIFKQIYLAKKHDFQAEYKNRQQNSNIQTQYKRHQNGVLKGIKFTQTQQKQLQTKYNNLSLKLDLLKQKIIHQSKYQSSASISTRSARSPRRQVINIYNTLSPLKRYEQMRNSRILKQKQNQNYNNRRRIDFAQILRH